MLQNILNQYKEKIGREAAAPVNEQDLNIPAETGSVDKPVDIAITDEKQSATEQSDSITPVPAAQTPEQPQLNKWGYDTSTMDYLAQNGYTPEKLEYFNSGEYDPSKHGSYMQRIYESSVTKPVAPDEKKIKRARTISGIGDALGLVSQMISSGMGAHVRERDYERSALGRTEGKERELRNLYRQERTRYDDGAYNARLKDLLQGLDEYNKGRAGIQGVISAKQKLDQVQAKLDADAAKAAQSAQIAQGRADETARHNKAMEAQGWAKIQDTKNRTTAYIKRASSGNGKNSNYQVIIPANPKDMEAQADQFGNNVRTFDLSPGQVDRFFRDAIADGDWLAENFPQFNTSKLPHGEKPKAPTEKERADIAVAFFKRLYNNQWAGTYTQSPGWLEELSEEYEETPDEWDAFEIY